MLSAETVVRPRTAPATGPACRLCGARLFRTLIDLGEIPLANRTIAADAPYCQPYRLHARICDNCTLVQVADVALTIRSPPPEPINPPSPPAASAIPAATPRPCKSAST